VWRIGLALISACLVLQPAPGWTADAQPGGRPPAPSRAPFPFPPPATNTAQPAPNAAATAPQPTPAPALSPAAPATAMPAPPVSSNVPSNVPSNVSSNVSADVKVRKPAQLNEAPLAGTTLRFENAEIYEVIQVVLGDILHLNYLVDPSVQGKITLHTQEMISTADVFGILESVLRLHNVSIVREGKLYKVLRDASATRDAIGFEAAGENSPLIQVVPLKFVQASALVNVLRNFVGPQGAITNDATNRYLVVADRASNIVKLLGMIASLDVDYLQHIRVRIVQITKGDAAELAREMDALFRSSGLFNWPGTDGNKVFFMPVARMNAILVAAANDALLAAAEKWIRTLDDEPKDGVGASIHVYSIANSNALHIANILRQIYGGAPISSAAGDPTRVVVRGAVPPAAATGATTAGTGLSGSVQIIPDEATNVLVIKASPQDYLQIKRVIERIDTIPRQVMIQVMVAEVTLTEQLQYGVEWWLKNRTASAGLDAGLVAPAGNPVTSVPAGGVIGGLNFLLFNKAGDITGLFNLLATNTDVNILSAPHVLASDGKVAKIEVGSEEPVVTQTVSAPTTTAGGTLSTSNSVQYRPTGILLEVKPSINASGLVTLTVTQEVSARGGDVGVGGSVYPSFTKRKVSTEVTLEEGRTLMIAGLIQDKGNKTSQGLPSLKDIPLIGVLFGTKNRVSDKTELMMTITPYIVRNKDEGEQLTQSFQDSVAKLKGLMQQNPRPALAEPRAAR
jgi:general secretion pathway protein D